MVGGGRPCQPITVLGPLRRYLVRDWIDEGANGADLDRDPIART